MLASSVLFTAMTCFSSYPAEEQVKWWKRLYFNGLGEFYYTNGIEENEEDFMDIKALGETWRPETSHRVFPSKGQRRKAPGFQNHR